MNLIKELIELFRKKKPVVEEVNCYDCRKYRTMMCPNSFECHNTKDKPHFERL